MPFSANSGKSGRRASTRSVTPLLEMLESRCLLSAGIPMTGPGQMPAQMAASTVAASATPVRLWFNSYGAATATQATTLAVSLYGAKNAVYSRGPLPNSVWHPVRSSVASASLPAGAAINAGIQLSPSDPIFDYGGGIAPGLPIPTGTVIFYEGQTRIGQATLDNNGFATFTPSKPLGPGKHTMAAHYCGDTHYAAATSQWLLVNPTGTVNTNMLIAREAPAGKPLLLTATVFSSWDDRVRPTGIVTIKEGTRIITTLKLGSGVSGALLSLSAGAHQLTATYSGDAVCRPCSRSFTVQVAARR